ncbi:MAG TPA: class I tRNA ligase family protein, partial [Chitinophagales bacterium]|nr:class I tRNA ligase family protein [Chitinophagales bacterium]
DGTIAPAAQLFIGEDRFKARKLAVAKLEEEGLLIKKQDYINKVGRSERTKAIIEPRLSLQWFVDMKKFFAKNPQVLDDVMEDKIKFYPAKFKNTYKHWIDNVRDWCISRQLWWGQRIPAWYDEKGNLVAVAKTEAEALAKFKAENPKLEIGNLKQDEDVLDTWFSSWLWPISVFDGFENPSNKDIQYYYPTNDLVTAPEIMFFWVMRMIMAGYEWRGQMPFRNVYYTGIVRDKLRRKMSKSLGNSPEPLELIEKFGADGVRMGMLLCSPAGNDILFDEKLCEQGRNFSNKLWNALRLIKGWEIKDGENAANRTSIEWFESKLNKTVTELNGQFESFRLSEALMTVYKLAWDDFCSWYLELVKPDYQQAIDRYTYDKTIDAFEKLVQLLHPFMPFITEEIWHTLRERKDGESINLSQWPQAGTINEPLLSEAQLSFDLITNIREIRARANKKNTETVDAFYVQTGNESFNAFAEKIAKLARLDKLEEVKEDKHGMKTFITGSFKFFIATGEVANEGEEKKRLQSELEYARGFLASVERKLANEKFVSSAPPAVVESEKKKREDALRKIAVLEQSLQS